MKHLKDADALANGKLRYDLIPHEAMEALALGFTIGAKQHAPNGWQTGGSWGHYFGAIMRHAWLFWRGQEYDTDGKHHLDGLLCSAAILRAMVARKIGDDSRSLTLRERRSIAAKIKAKFKRARA